MVKATSKRNHPSHKALGLNAATQPLTRCASVCQPKVFIKTFGCQMNIRDAEIVKGLLIDDGFRIADDGKGSLDAVLFVTCSVRQHAEDRVWSEIGWFSKLKGKFPTGTLPIIGLVGCMAENYKKEAFKRMPGIDLVVGTNNIGEIPRLLRKAFEERQGAGEGRYLAVSKKERDEFVYQPAFREAKDNSFVVISEGCDNFCSYCVVPYVRGRLRHRQPENILREIRVNIDKGINSLTLIGQNVNSYECNGTDFTRLLEKVDSLEGLKEFTFFTSHPKDAARKLFTVMSALERLKKYLHLPAQSGSDRILGLMKRGYSRKQYLSLVEAYRKIVKNGALTTDIIAGFPGETEEDFEATLDLLKTVRFNGAFIFKYSPRPHTRAAKLKDDVPRDEKERRHRILLETQRKISRELKDK
ncbi:tRNA (N6-isopentenyl adenosine(37)-C2)-methylthiotransferase MiaB [bacterium]|nr:MAG: tRNA (N6-isopentenyl adenosine(37)-C2)-methylthiotransferase MiaB [bacterium]